jgi:outer membrane immunogenic protein
MRKQLLSGASVAALLIAAGSAPALLSDHANAADLRPAYKAPPPPPAPVYSWTGCYTGAQVGWGWGSNNFTESSFSGGFLNRRQGHGGVNTSGGLFGGQLGCNYQFSGNWVVGIQGDFAGTDFNGRAGDGLADRFETETTVALKTDWLASITGRIGWAFWNNQALVYVKGGGAWIHNKWDLHDAFFAFNPSQLEDTRSGWTVGGGFEWTLWSPAWTAFVEYNFYEFNSGGDLSNAFGSNETRVLGQARQEINTVKVGVNYRFWGSGGWGGP